MFRTYTKKGIVIAREEKAPYKLLLSPGAYGKNHIDKPDGEIVRSEIAGILAGYDGPDYDHVYGSLDCGSGKRMRPENRVFFRSQDDAIILGYRPCLNCSRTRVPEYLERKKDLGIKYTTWDSKQLKRHK